MIIINEQQKRRRLVGKEDDRFHRLGNLRTDAVAGEESGANQIGVRIRVRGGGRGEIAIESHRKVGFKNDIVWAAAASKESSADLRSHFSLAISGGASLLFLSPH